ncbi:MAG: hypothetical protein RLZZ387_1270 [Chloroflexota bacterium]|jgi:nitrite reductase/ring-hydroxylating ferredoxin subunit
MTPLAHALVADSTLPVKDRRYGDLAQKLQILDGLHFFDVSAVMEAAATLSEKAGAAFLLGHDQRAFLPAPRVMLEWAASDPHVAREALILAEREDGLAAVTVVCQGHDGKIASTSGAVMFMPLRGAEDRAGLWIPKRAAAGFDGDGIACLVYALLAMINTPRVIGRRQHQPHAGLQRKIAAAHRMPGKYPLQAWHELVLEVTPPQDESDRESRGIILTSGKALHFVRAYLRIRSGVLELVSSHWKGDAVLGIRQTRYRLVPPRRAA